MVETTGTRKLFVVAGHLPPPTHGEAIATQIFGALLDQSAEQFGVHVEHRRISAHPTPSRLRHHLQRCRRVTTTIGWIIKRRKDVCGLYISVDAGYGMIYTMALCLTARWCRVDAYVHHHSASYLGDRPEFKMKLLCGFSGKQAQHLVGCELTATRLIQLYGKRNVRVLPICFAVEIPTQVSRSRSRKPIPHQRASPPEIRVGHLSNLSVEKGLTEVFQTLDTLEREGLTATLVLAGPPLSRGDAERLEELLAAAQHQVEYVGPVYGDERERFFDDIDIFLFPSRYRHESFGLVVGEALSRLIPVVAYTSGCLTADLVGRAGRILPQSAAFPTEAAEWIHRTVGDPKQWEEAIEGTVLFTSLCHTARNRAREVAREMLSTGLLRS